MSESSAILTTGCSDELERHWKWKFLKMGRQFSVGLDRPVKEDHFDLKISTWAKPFHLRLDRNFRKFWHNGIQPKSPCFDLFMLWLIKLITDPSPNHFSGSIVALTDWFAKGSMHFDYWYLPRVFWNLKITSSQPQHPLTPTASCCITKHRNRNRKLKRDIICN